MDLLDKKADFLEGAPRLQRLAHCELWCTHTHTHEGTKQNAVSCVYACVLCIVYRVCVLLKTRKDKGISPLRERDALSDDGEGRGRLRVNGNFK